MCSPEHACVEARSWFHVISSIFLHLIFFFETFSHWTWSMPFWLATRALKIILSLSPPTRDKDACLAFYVGAECPNSGSHSLVDRTLLTETFPYMWKIYIYISIYIYNPGRNVYLSMYICMHIFPYIFLDIWSFYSIYWDSFVNVANYKFRYWETLSYANENLCIRKISLKMFV